MHFLNSSSIFLQRSILLNNQVNQDIPSSSNDFQSFIRIQSEPIAFPIFILLKAFFFFFPILIFLTYLILSHAKFIDTNIIIECKRLLKIYNKKHFKIKIKHINWLFLHFLAICLLQVTRMYRYILEKIPRSYSCAEHTGQL